MMLTRKFLTLLALSFSSIVPADAVCPRGTQYAISNAIVQGTHNVHGRTVTQRRWNIYDAKCGEIFNHISIADNVCTDGGPFSCAGGGRPHISIYHHWGWPEPPAEYPCKLNTKIEHCDGNEIAVCCAKGF